MDEPIPKTIVRRIGEALVKHHEKVSAEPLPDAVEERLKALNEAEGVNPEEKRDDKS